MIGLCGGCGSSARGHAEALTVAASVSLGVATNPVKTTMKILRRAYDHQPAHQKGIVDRFIKDYGSCVCRIFSSAFSEGD
jgi:hypothetical protein